MSLMYLIGCKSLPVLPKTLGEANSAYSYIPIDPLPIFEEVGRNCKLELDTIPLLFKELLESLPDQAVRLAIAQLNGTASGSFGPVSVGYENNSYQVVLDYISVDATQIPVYVKREISSGPDVGKEIPLYDDTKDVSSRYKVKAAHRINPFAENPSKEFKRNQSEGELVVFPIYIGVGLRLTAKVFVLEGSVNLSSLGSLAAGAEAGKLTGSLTVQTLGITGDNVAISLPLPSEINQTTIQNAILSLGSIKAILYDNENTKTTPRVVGIYNPIGGGKEVVNGIISVLAENPISWYRPCVNNRIQQ
jgi:hypothetical protein